MADLVVALDFPGREEALRLVDTLGGGVGRYKVGLELFTRAGPEVVRAIRSRGKDVFLDLKLHDIPNTVARAARAAAELEVDLLTVHAVGGERMIGAAKAALEGTPTRLLAVTLLTSVSAIEGGSGTASTLDEVVRLAERAVESGADGIVSSAGEVSALQDRLGTELLFVVPGIRLPGDERGDQERVFSPFQAVQAGADLLVVGRPITRAADPVLAVERFRQGMAAELTEV